jgi:hypothetical protein
MVANSFVFLYALFGVEYVGHNSTHFGSFIRLNKQIKIADIGFMNEISLHF